LSYRRAGLHQLRHSLTHAAETGPNRNTLLAHPAPTSAASLGPLHLRLIRALGVDATVPFVELIQGHDECYWRSDADAVARWAATSRPVP